MQIFFHQGSASHELVETWLKPPSSRARNGTPIHIDGELQRDAALYIGCHRKCAESSVAGKANVLIFGSSVGEIGTNKSNVGGGRSRWTILQRMGAPVNDLSEGCS
jgi:phosphotransacetylase